MEEPSLHFRRRHRLSLDRDYQAVFEARVRTTRGPITVYAKPNGLGHARLGLSIGRRAGGAVARVAIKRRLREAFRHLRPEMPTGYDLIVTTRAHKPMPMARYLESLGSAWEWLDKSWRRRGPGGDSTAHAERDRSAAP